MKKSRRLTRLMTKLSRRPIAKIKLVAIAKNEAAYLPEWILHHLYFGFDKIEIHYNGTNDNTAELSTIFYDKPVSFFDVDPIFDKIGDSPQTYIYKRVLKSSFYEGFDAVLFLDIDEFWTPSDLSTKIHDIVNNIEFFDTLSFQWKNKYEQNEKFAPAIQSHMLVEHSEHLKTLVKCYISPLKMNAHNVLDKRLVQRFEDGTVAMFLDEQNSRVKINTTPQNAFILHRKERSEKEYLASLLRGRPIGKKKQGLPLKNNRSGFNSNRRHTSLDFPAENLSKYRAHLESMTTKELQLFQKEARKTVEARYLEFIDFINDSYEAHASLFLKLLRGVSDERVVNILAEKNNQ